MPDGNGLDLLQRVRDEKLPTPVIMITAHTSTEDAVEAMKRGAVRLHLQTLQHRRARPRRAPGPGREAAPGREPATCARSSPASTPSPTSSAAAAACRRSSGPSRRIGKVVLDGAADRRERHGQGADRAGHPLLLDPQGPASSSRSTAAPCPRRCWSPSSSATSAAPSPAPSARSGAYSRRPTAGRCSSTRSPRRRRRCRSSSCGRSRRS